MAVNFDEAMSLATRSDADTHTDVGFANSQSDDGRLFVSISRPHSPTGTGVVICPPLHADFAKNYRNEVLLARELARRGHAVIRFHYRGQGHSDGTPDLMSIDSLKEDAFNATGLLRQSLGVVDVAYVGCRVGGFVAAATAASNPAAPLALWEPVLKPAAYLRDAIRARLIGRVTGASETGTSAAELNEQLIREGSLDIYGYPIYRRLIESLEGLDLRSQLGEGKRPVLLIQISSRSDLRSEYAGFAEELTADGIPLSISALEGTVGWWFRGAGRGRDQPDVLTNETVTATMEWLDNQLQAVKVPE